jgi:hypothetical protein
MSIDRRGIASRIRTLSKRVGSGRELARLAGLTAGETYISTLVRRLETHPKASVGVDTLAAIAAGANVSLMWLITGQDTGPAGFHARSLPGWAEAEAEARVRFPLLPEVALRAAGEFMLPTVPARVDAGLVGELARIWYEAAAEADRRPAPKKKD